MLQFIRKGLTSWPVLGILGLVLVAFIITGVGDPFASGGAAGGRGIIAKVGSKTLAEADLLEAFDQVVRNAREQNPQTNQADLARQGAVPAVAAQLIGRTALEEFARSQGLTASDRAIGAVIAGIPAFQSGGKFDDATYRNVLSQQRMTDAQLRGSIAGDVLRKQLLTPVTAALDVPTGLAQPYARVLLDIYRGGVALVPPANVAPVSDAEVTKFYTANRTRFTVPERRAFRYALIDATAIAATVTVSDAQIAAAFQKDAAKYGAAATRLLQQVVVPDEAKAKAIAAAAATEGFAKAAERLAGFGAADIAIGTKAQVDFARETSPAVAAAAFALPLGGVSVPIKSDFGWHVLRYDAAGAAGKSLAEARPQIEAELRKRAIADALAAKVADIETDAEDGKSFADIAREQQLTILTQTAVTKDGTAPDVPQIAGDPLLLAPLAFRHEPGEGAAVENIAPQGSEARLMVIETMNVIPAAPRPLAEIKPLVTALANRDKALKAARAKADAVVAAVKKGTDFAAAVAAQGLDAPQPLAGRRFDVMQQQNVPPIIRAFLSTAPGSVRVISGAEGWVLINVASIEKGDTASVPGLVDAGRREMASQLPDEFAAAFAAASERAVKVARNEGNILATAKRLAGTDTP